jgi:tight adherence protein D
MRKEICLLLALLLSGCASAPHKFAGASSPPDQTLTPASESDLYLGVVNGLIQQGRYEAAIAFLAQYQKSQPPSPRYYKLVGDALSGAGRYDEAVASYRQALKSDYAPEAYNGIGRTLSLRGSWAEAAENFRKAATLNPSNATYLNNFGYAQLKQNFHGPELAPVVRELERAHELDPGSAVIRNNLALALALSGAKDEYRDFLQTIADPGQRREVAKFSASWTPAWTDDTGIRKSVP